MPGKKVDPLDLQFQSLIPIRIRPLFTDLPILTSEDPNIFFALLFECIKSVDPRDYFEWVWVRDISLLNWEIRRLHGFKWQIIEVGRIEVMLSSKPANWDPGENATDEVIDPWLKSNVVSAGVLLEDKFRFDTYQALDRMIASAELRRDKIIRELECHREHVARHPVKPSAAIIDGRFRAKKSAA
jgi:hypothetical protein